MNTIAETQQQIIDDFSTFSDWMDKYAYIIELGKNLPPMDEHLKTTENKVSGCQSQVWIHAEMNGKKIQFQADSDAFITKGLVTLLWQIFNNRTPEEIIDAKLYFIDKIGLSEHLSMNRANGLSGMVERFFQFARLNLENKLKK